MGARCASELFQEGLLRTLMSLEFCFFGGASQQQRASYRVPLCIRIIQQGLLRIYFFRGLDLTAFRF